MYFKIDRSRFLIDYANRLLDVGGFGAIPLTYLFHGISKKSVFLLNLSLLMILKL